MQPFHVSRDNVGHHLTRNFFRLRRGRSGRLGRGVSRGTIDDDAGGEIAVVEIRIRFAEFGDHLVDFVSKDAARTRDQLRQRCRLHFARSCRFAR